MKHRIPPLFRREQKYDDAALQLLHKEWYIMPEVSEKD
jgi:hypothetical protein